ncbi:MAG: sensor histidine kinase [Burkholderiales bacterium]
MSELARVLAALWAVKLALIALRLPRHVECDALLERARLDAKAELDAAGAQVHGGSLPRVRADAAQLERVFRVLLVNAARHRGAEPPIIHVSARPAGREWQFSVRDNGAGIDPARHHDIFNPLTGARELPACRAIVWRHGGRLWVESAQGQGATFHFTLPATRRMGYAA